MRAPVRDEEGIFEHHMLPGHRRALLAVEVERGDIGIGGILDPHMAGIGRARGDQSRVAQHAIGAGGAIGRGEIGFEAVERRAARGEDAPRIREILDEKELRSRRAGWELRGRGGGHRGCRRRDSLRRRRGLGGVGGSAAAAAAARERKARQRKPQQRGAARRLARMEETDQQAVPQ